MGAEATAALMAPSSELGLGLLGREERREVMRSWQGAPLAVSVMASFTQSACITCSGYLLAAVRAGRACARYQGLRMRAEAVFTASAKTSRLAAVNACRKGFEIPTWRRTIAALGVACGGGDGLHGRRQRRGHAGRGRGRVNGRLCRRCGRCGRLRRSCCWGHGSFHAHRRGCRRGIGRGGDGGQGEVLAARGAQQGGQDQAEDNEEVARLLVLHSGCSLLPLHATQTCRAGPRQNDHKESSH